MNIIQKVLGKLRPVEIAIFSVFLIVVIALALTLTGDAVEQGDLVTNVLFGMGAAVSLLAALTFRLAFKKLDKVDKNRQESIERNFRGWKLTFLSPLVVILALLPSILSGGLGEDFSNPIGSVFGLLLLLYAAVLIGFLAFPFIVLPIELALTSLYALVVKRDASKVVYLFVAAFIASITAFIFIMALAVDVNLPWPISMVPAVGSLLGIPGDYVVKSEPLLWVGRAILGTVIAAAIVVAAAGKRQVK